MTDAQWNPYAKGLKGRLLTGQGWITEVNEKLFGGYELWLDMDDPEQNPLSVQDVSFDIPKDNALGLNKGEQVQFTGYIKVASNLGGITCSVQLGYTEWRLAP